MQSVALSVAGGFALSFTNGDDGGVSVFGCIDTVAARLKDGKGLIGGVDFENVVAIEIPNANVNRAGAELDLNRAVVQIEKREASVRREIDHGRSELNFRSRIAIGPQLVTCRHGTIRNGLHPLRFSSGLEGNGPFHIAQARDASGRIILILIVLRVIVLCARRLRQRCGEQSTRVAAIQGSVRLDLRMPQSKFLFMNFKPFPDARSVHPAANASEIHSECSTTRPELP